MNWEKLLCIALVCMSLSLCAQQHAVSNINEEVPGLFDYIPVDESPRALNFAEVRKIVGYPPAAMSAGIEGKVLCRVLIDKEGHYIQHKITRADHPELGKAVDPHIHLLKFTPAVSDNHPIVYWANVKFDFKSETQHYEFAKHQSLHAVSKDLKNAEDRARFFLREGKIALKHYNYQSASRLLTQTLAVCDAKSAKEKYLLMKFDAYSERSKAFMELNYHEDALKDLTLAIGMARSDLDHRHEIRNLLPYLYHRRASYYLRLDQALQALEDLQWIDKFYPCKIPFAKAQLAELMLEIGETKAALAHIDEVTRCEISSFDEQSDRIKAYVSLLKGIACIQNKSYQEAFTFLAIANEKNPDNPLTFFYKGLAIWELGGVEYAQTNFKEALKRGLSGKRRQQCLAILNHINEGKHL